MAVCQVGTGVPGTAFLGGIPLTEGLKLSPTLEHTLQVGSRLVDLLPKVSQMVLLDHG